MLKGLRMVAHALWRSEACRLCLGRRPCTSHRRVQGSSQGTTLSVSDLHNAPATILNLFYNMEYDMIRKIRQHTTWIGADILGINLTPNWYNALAPAIVYVSNDVTAPIKLHDVTIATQRMLPRAHWNGSEIILKSTDWYNDDLYTCHQTSMS